MNALERLGMEVAAFMLLGSRGRAALLMALIDGAGVTVSRDALAEARAWRTPRPTDESGCRSVKTRVSLLREAMDDVGLGGLIETRPEGYALPPAGRKAVIDRLALEAGA